MTEPRALRVLHVANGYPPDDRGGVERYTQLLCHALTARGHEVKVFCRAASPRQRDLTVVDGTVAGVPVRRVVNNFDRVTGFADYYHSRPIEEIFARTLREWEPDVVHFQHAIGLSASLPARARAFGARTFWTLMDYWPICPVNNLLLRDGSLCPGPHHGANCFVCLYGGPRALPGRHVPDLHGSGDGARHWRPGVNEATMHLLRRHLPRPVRLRALSLYHHAADVWPRRRPAAGTAGTGAAGVPGDPPLPVAYRAAYMRGMLGACDAVVALLPFAVDTFADFGLPRDRMVVVDPGMDTRGWDRRPRAARPAGAPLRLGYIGSLMRHKGVDVIVRAVRALPDRDLELRLHGFYVPGDVFADQLRQLVRSDPRVREMGAYEPEALPAILAHVDVVLVPSPWHETYSFVTREAVLAGAPVLAADMGGMRDAIVDGENGRLLPAGDVAAWSAAIRDLADHPEQVAAMGEAQARRPVRDVRAAAADFEALYLSYDGARQAGSTGRPAPGPTGVAAP
jgi:glycosyltransferase involved in cell wall biosynthesis